MQGSLESMSLASLVQMICLEERNAALHLEHQGQEGIIYFDRGNIVHASAGHLSGEEAAYRLVGWRKGSFRVNFNVTVPRRSVSIPWNHLLIEGMRRIDEEQSGDLGPGHGRQLLSTREIEQDDALGNEMILLLSRLEFSRAQLEEKKARTRPSVALGILTEMLNQVVDLSEARADGGSKAESLSEIFEMAGRALPGARMVRVHNNRISYKTVSQFERLRGDTVARRETFHQIAETITIVLESYLARLTERFRSGPVADQWRETYGGFLHELNQVLENIGI